MKAERKKRNLENLKENPIKEVMQQFLKLLVQRKKENLKEDPIKEVIVDYKDYKEHKEHKEYKEYKEHKSQNQSKKKF